jgi:hypothetical protein
MREHPSASWTDSYTGDVQVPNPPRMITVVIAVILLIVGVSLEGSVLAIPQLNQLVTDVLRQVDLGIARETLARLLIIASPVLLILGSLVRGL